MPSLGHSWKRARSGSSRRPTPARYSRRLPGKHRRTNGAKWASTIVGQLFRPRWVRARRTAPVAVAFSTPFSVASDERSRIANAHLAKAILKVGTAFEPTADKSALSTDTAAFVRARGGFPLYRRPTKTDDRRVRTWLVKTEPETYSWDDLVRDGVGCWDGVRNVEARNNLRAMEVGDTVFVYHSGKARCIVGVARVTRTAYRDPSSSRAIWSAVDLAAEMALDQPVTLATIKGDGSLATCPLARRARLSVMPVEAAHAARILELAKTPVPDGDAGERAP